MEERNRLTIYLENGKILNFTNVEEEYLDFDDISGNLSFTYEYSTADGVIMDAAALFKLDHISGYVIMDTDESELNGEHDPNIPIGDISSDVEE